MRSRLSGLSLYAVRFAVPSGLVEEGHLRADGDQASGFERTA